MRVEVNSPDSLAQAGGIDIRVYRVPDALGFLQKQKNLHRVQIDAAPADPGVSNTLTHLWDSWQAKARLTWQGVFSSDARSAVVAQAPTLKTPPGLRQPSTFDEPTQYKPIAGMTLLEHFRYPIQNAAPIGLPKDLALQGSSSNFIAPTQGNVFVPLGKRAPGLYLVEAIAGDFRATTLMFVSDSVAITKISGDQMLVWSHAPRRWRAGGRHARRLDRRRRRAEERRHRRDGVRDARRARAPSRATCSAQIPRAACSSPRTSTTTARSTPPRSTPSPTVRCTARATPSTCT